MVFPIPAVFKPVFRMPEEGYVVTYASYPTHPMIGFGVRQAIYTPSLKYRQKISLIACVKNEETNIAGWFQRINAQTRLPDEVIIVDGGSTDGTRKILEVEADKCAVPTRLIFLAGWEYRQKQEYRHQQGKPCHHRCH